MTPLPWQTEPIEVLTAALRNRVSAVDASDTGTGKTFVALSAAKAAGLPVGVICPISVIPNWRETAAALGVKTNFILNVEQVKKQKPKFEGVTVFDEVHRFAAPNTQNAKLLRDCPRPVLMLSATCCDSPIKMRAIAHQLGICNWNDWWQWCGRNGCYKPFFGGLAMGPMVKVNDGALKCGHKYPRALRNDCKHVVCLECQKIYLTRLHEQIRGVRVRIDDIRQKWPGAFPEMRLEPVLVPVTGAKTLDAAYLQELAELESMSVGGVRLIRARQMSEHMKLPSTFERIDDLVEQGHKVVLFANFRDTLTRLQEHYNCPVIWGEQTREERAAAIDTYQHEASVIGCMSQAGGCGLDGLQDREGTAPRVGLIFPGHSAVDFRQMLGRLPRANAKSNALYQILLADGTEETHIYKKLGAKLTRIDLINDGDLMPTKNEITTKQGCCSTVCACTVPAESPPVHPGGSELPGADRASDGAADSQRNTPSPEPRAHAKISPSRLKNLEISPLYIDDPNAEVHPVTEEGLRCHAVLEGKDVPLNEEQIQMVGWCNDYTRHFEGRMHYEQRLDICEGIWGYADAIIEHVDSADLIDYKFGYNLQEDCETNPAAQAYVLGVFNKWPKIQRVDVHYLYPRLLQVSTASYTRKDIDRIRLRISTIKARVEQATECNPTYDTCMYCGRKATCPDLHKTVLPIATRYAGKHELRMPDAWDAEMITDPWQMSKALVVAGIMEKWADSVKFHALKMRREDGKEIPGFDLRTRAGKAKILSPTMAFKIAEGFGLDRDAFLACVDVSASQLSDAASALAKRGMKAKVKQQLLDKLRDEGVLTEGAESEYLQKTK